MKTYVTGSGQLISLGQRLAAGGEGEIYEVSGNPKVVAKLYYKPPDARKAAKLDWMARLANEAILKFAAWPMTTLHDGVNLPAKGLLMPRVTGARPVHELDTPAHRRAHYPHADWRFLIRTGRNCAAAVTALHDSGIVLGDVNQGGFLVSRDALVNVIDCDSFQIRAASDTFLCEVAVPEFLPPELHGRKLSTTIRTANHDAFGLAIVIFRLLMMGRHPYAGYRGRGDKPIPEAVKEYRFAFGPDATNLQMSPPPHSLLLPDLPNEIATNFLRAFSRGSEHDGVRPSARQWAESLARLESQLTRCVADPGHYYFASLRECPWCRIERGNGPNYFISVSISILSAAPAQVDVGPVWLQITRIRRPATWITQQGATIRCAPTPLPPDLNDDKAFLRWMGILAVGSCGSLLFGLEKPAFLIFMFPVCLAIVTVWVVSYLNSPRQKELSKRRQSLMDRTSELANAETALQRVIDQLDGEFSRRLAELGNIHTRCLAIDSQESVELHQLQSHAKERQLDAYLEQFFIEAAKLKGIGTGRIATLASYNVETAADVTKQALAPVPGIGPKLTEQLLDWRREKERPFKFDPVRGLPQADLLKLRNKFLQMRYAAQRKLEVGKEELQRITSQAKEQAERMAGQLRSQRVAAAQARADVEVCERR